ncbi:Vegetative incompatibility protein HET-E-1 [Podospora anserina] [Rhizoctonia solani]|uniref:Vegetative incompatibility protein HET-E-1 [Podospora anserina] n=1 Tax=Rhizoctonia solani TaxID=456999 RepID=A0A0K6GDD7_9AGAM|nr:Vegetative incompatibility protein HET-E-1 [Podospora anserina] [Rhizoctonia solani]
MEVMNIKGYKGSMPGMIWQVKEWSQETSAAWKELIYDVWRFTSTFSLSSISESTPHIYISMLSFWPESSPVAKLYSSGKAMIKLEGTAMKQQQWALLATWNFDGRAHSPVFSPNGMQAAVGIEGRVLLLSASTGHCQMVLLPPKKHPYFIQLVKFSLDGAKLISVNGWDETTVRLWNVQKGEIALEKDGGPICSVAFSPEGNRIALGSKHGDIEVWDTSTGRELLKLVIRGSLGINAVKFSPDGRYLVACGYRYILMWDTEGQEVLKTTCHHENAQVFTSADISPDCKRVASGSQNNTVCIWDIKTGQVVVGPLQVASVIDYTPVESISYSSDGLQLVSGSRDGTICVWDAQCGNLMLRLLEENLGEINSVNFSPNGGYIISSSSNKFVRLWDAHHKQMVPDLLPGHTDNIQAVRFSPDGTRIVSSAQNNNLCIWDTGTGAIIFEFPVGPAACRLSEYSPEGSRILCDTDTGPLLLDAETGNILSRLRYPSLTVMGASSGFSTDGAYIISMVSVKSQPVSIRQSPTDLKSPTNSESTTNWHSPVNRISYPVNCTVRISAADSGQILMVINSALNLNAYPEFIKCAILPPDNARIAVGVVNNGLCVFDSSNGRLIHGPDHFGMLQTQTAAFSPDGTRLVSSNIPTLTIKDIQTGKDILKMPALHRGWVTSTDFSPDGTHIVSGDHDHAICVWDAYTGQPSLGPAKWHTDVVSSVKFSPDGTHVVSGSRDKTIRITDVRGGSEHLTDTIAPAGSDWELKSNGWVIDEQGRLLVWVPPELHMVLMWPSTKLLICKKGWLRLNFSDAHLGDSWTEWYRPYLE